VLEGGYHVGRGSRCPAVELKDLPSAAGELWQDPPHPPAVAIRPATRVVGPASDGVVDLVAAGAVPTVPLWPDRGVDGPQGECDDHK
jgi:hypothetical protein